MISTNMNDYDSNHIQSCEIRDPFAHLYQNLQISCGMGFVSINLGTGEVTYDNCDPEQAARAFWDAVTRLYPSVRETIKNS